LAESLFLEIRYLNKEIFRTSDPRTERYAIK